MTRDGAIEQHIFLLNILLYQSIFHLFLIVTTAAIWKFKIETKQLKFNAIGHLLHDQELSSIKILIVIHIFSDV